MQRNIIGFGGKSGHGKDTAARMLIEGYGFHRYAFADPVRECLYLINPLVGGKMRIQEAVDDVGWDAMQQYPEVRKLLQNIGHHFRSLYGDHFWVARMRERIAICPSQDIVITDIRYPNELKFVRSFGGHTIYIERPDITEKEVHAHPSENQVTKDNFDQTITNISLEKMWDEVEKVLAERPRQLHLVV